VVGFVDETKTDHSGRTTSSMKTVGSTGLSPLNGISKGRPIIRRSRGTQMTVQLPSTAGMKSVYLSNSKTVPGIPASSWMLCLTLTSSDTSQTSVIRFKHSRREWRKVSLESSNIIDFEMIVESNQRYKGWGCIVIELLHKTTEADFFSCSMLNIPVELRSQKGPKQNISCTMSSFTMPIGILDTKLTETTSTTTPPTPLPETQVVQRVPSLQMNKRDTTEVASAAIALKQPLQAVRKQSSPNNVLSSMASSVSLSHVPVTVTERNFPAAQPTLNSAVLNVIPSVPQVPERLSGSSEEEDVLSILLQLQYLRPKEAKIVE